MQRLLDDIRRQELKQLVPEEITQIAQRLSIVMTEEDGQDSIVEQLVEKIIEAEKPPAPDSVDEAANKSEPATSTNAADFTKKHKEILIRSANLIPMDFTPTGAPQVSFIIILFQQSTAD